MKTAILPKETFRFEPLTRAAKAQRKLVCGIGVNDAKFNTIYRAAGGKVEYHGYKAWRDLLLKTTGKGREIYADCTISPDWRFFSNFDAFYRANHRPGWHLDKDIKVKGNRCYGEETCLYVPQSINNALNRLSNISKGKTVGVFTFTDKYRSRKPYFSKIYINGKHTHLGAFASV